MPARELVRTATAEPSLQADPADVFDAIIANTQSNIPGHVGTEPGSLRAARRPSLTEALYEDRPSPRHGDA